MGLRVTDDIREVVCSQCRPQRGLSVPALAVQPCPFVQRGQLATEVCAALVGTQYVAEQAGRTVGRTQLPQSARQVAADCETGCLPAGLVDLQRGSEQVGGLLQFALVQARHPETVERDGTNVAVLLVLGQLQGAAHPPVGVDELAPHHLKPPDLVRQVGSGGGPADGHREGLTGEIVGQRVLVSSNRPQRLPAVDQHRGLRDVVTGRGGGSHPGLCRR